MTTVTIKRRVIEMTGRGVRGLSAAGLARRHNGFTGTDAEYTDWLIGQVGAESPTWGIDHYADSYADAAAALGGYADGTVVMVWVDEEVDDHRTIYMVESAALVLKADLTALKPIDMGDVMAFIPASFRGEIMAGSSAVDVSTYVQLAHNTCYTVDYRRVGNGWLRTAASVTLRSGAKALQPRIKLLGDVGNIPIFTNETDQPANNAARDSNISILDAVLDGDRDNNPSGTEFSHAVLLHAVAGAAVTMRAENFKGDGFCAAPARDSDTTIVCEDLDLRVRARRCYRNSISIVGCERAIIDLFSADAGLCGLDLENDDGDAGTSRVRDIIARVVDVGSGYDYVGPEDAPRSGASLQIDGNNGLMDNIVVDLTSRDHEDSGVRYRGCARTTVRGAVKDCGGEALNGLQGAVGAAGITFDMEIHGCHGGLNDRTEGGGTLNTTRLIVRNATGDLGAQIEGKTGGTLAGLDIEGVDAACYLSGSSNMTFVAPRLVGTDPDTNQALVLLNSSNNRIHGGHLDGKTSAITESGTSAGNIGSEIDFIQAGAAVIGTGSIFTSRPYIGVANWNPPEIASGAMEDQPVTITGLDIGDMIDGVSFSQDQEGMSLAAYVAASGVARAQLENLTPSPRNLGAGVVRVIGRKVYAKAP